MGFFIIFLVKFCVFFVFVINYNFKWYRECKYKESFIIKVEKIFDVNFICKFWENV